MSRTAGCSGHTAWMCRSGNDAVWWLRLRIDPERSPGVFVPYEQIIALEIGGRGATRSGGGFVGGGFGVEGAAEGMLIASALNMLTTRTKIDTVLCVQSTNGEVFFLITALTPDALRIRLSPAFSAVRNCRRQQHLVGAIESERPDVIGQLQALVDMRARGVLTEGEFEDLKSQLLSDRARRGS